MEREGAVGGHSELLGRGRRGVDIADERQRKESERKEGYSDEGRREKRGMGGMLKRVREERKS